MLLYYEIGQICVFAAHAKIKKFKIVGVYFEFYMRIVNTYK
jgi:hypothetical protein